MSMSRPFHLLGALALIALPIQAQWISDPAANLAIADGSADQVQAKVRATASGGSFVSWFDSDPSGSPAFGFDVRVQQLDSGGHELFAHGGVLVADRGFSSTQDYGLAVDTAGNALIAFRDDRFSGTQVTAAKIDGTTGALTWGSAGIQLTNTTGFIATPMIAGTSDGGVVVGWSENSDLHLMKLDGSGVPVWPSDVILSPPADNYGISDLKASDAGGVIVSFVLYGGFTSPRHLYAQKLDASGNLLWGAMHVVVFDGGSLQFGNFPNFVTDGNGGAAFGWYSTSPLESYAQHILSDGTEAFAHNGVAASTNAAQLRVSPSVAFDSAANEIVLSYIEENSGQSNFGVSAQRFDSSGNRLWTSTGTSIVAIGSSAVIDVDGLNFDGDSMVFWISEPSFAQAKIFGATLDTSGVVTAGPFDVSSTPAGKSRLQAERGTTETPILAFSDDRNGNDDLYVQNALPDGTLGGVASAVSRNGSGVNSVCLTATNTPVIGKSWDVEVDTSAHSGATLSLVAIYSQPASGPILAIGELLVDVTSPFVAGSSLVTGGLDLHSITVPNQVSIIGQLGYAQAAILGGGIELCNALDASVGL